MKLIIRKLEKKHLPMVDAFSCMETQEMLGYEHRVSFYESVGFVKNMVQPIFLPYDTPISMRIGLEEYLERVGKE